VATLEVAADELVRKLKQVDDEVEEAHEKFATFKGQIASLGDQVDDGWVELAKAVAELTEKAGEEMSTLAQETQESAQAVASVGGQSQAAQEGFTAGFEGAEQGTNQLAEGVRGFEPQVEQMVSQGGEQTFQALQEQAGEIADQLEQVLQEGRDFLNDEVAAALDQMNNQVTEAFDEMRTTLTEECTTALQNAYDDWSAKLDEVMQLVREDGFEAAAENADEVVAWALGECATKHEEEFNRLMEVAEVVQQALTTLQDELGEHKTDVAEEGRNALEGAMAETQTALTGMIGALDAVKQTLASYSFVQL